ncbi:sec-independent protein translocase protein TatA, partial [Candidatus Termititenax persephonae]
MVGGMELIIIGVVIVLLFGGAQLPKLARSLGGFFSEFNAAKEEAE